MLVTRRHAPRPFVFTSTNKVYGDTPNRLPLVEKETRWEVAEDHAYFDKGIDKVSIDNTLHSLFGASKVSADVMVQEYGRYFGLKTACFRGGCLTGPGHSGAELHGFLAYLAKCALTGRHYTVFGYKGKQVQDNIHSYDLVNAFWHFFEAPARAGSTTSAAGRTPTARCWRRSRWERMAGNAFNWSYSETNRVGDHLWWISDISKFEDHFPKWSLQYDMEGIMEAVIEGQKARVDLAEPADAHPRSVAGGMGGGFEPKMLSVLIPAHNEEGHIAETIGLFADALEKEQIPYEVLVVNDNSGDRTEEILKEVSEKNPRSGTSTTRRRTASDCCPSGLVVLQGRVCHRHGGCFRRSGGSVKYYRKWKSHDCVFGTRFARESRLVVYPWVKLIFNRLGNLFIQGLFMWRYNDTTNFQALRPERHRGASAAVVLPLQSDGGIAAQGDGARVQLRDRAEQLV